MAKKKSKKTETSKSTSKYDEAIQLIRKEYGTEALQVGCGTFIKVNTFSSGIYTLDWAMGCGGLPRGRIIEVFGGESSGKTTMALKAIASCQRTIIDDELGVAAFIDAEHALDPEWARANGVNLDKLLLSQPNCGEEALGTVSILVKVGIPLVVIDSVAALTPKKELEGEMGDHHVGAQARLMSQGLRKLVGDCKKSQSIVLFINQLREKVGVMFGSPEVTPGGRALKFYSSIRVDMRGSTILKENEDVVIGRRTNAKIIKNKVAPPWKKAEIEIFFGSDAQKPFPMWGADERASLLKAAKLMKIITLRGSHHYFGDVALGNGADKAMASLSDEALFTEIRDKFLEAIKPTNVLEAKDTDEEAETPDSEE